MQKWFIFIHLLVSMSKVKGQDLFLDPTVLSAKIKDFVEHSLKAKEIQKYFDSFSYIDDSLGEKEIDQIIQSIGGKFQNQIQAVHNLEECIKATYLKFSQSEPGDCCRFTDVKYSQFYFAQVNEESACHYIPPINQTEVFIPPLQNFKEACLNNSKHYKATRWQYFATEDSVQMLYPALTLQCNIDAKLHARPWFFQAYVPFRSKVVILIDESSSLKKAIDLQNTTVRDIIAKAVNDVLDSLSHYDKFAVIGFSENPVVLGGDIFGGPCFSKSLAQATSRNKRKMKDYLSRITGKGKRNFSKALERAFLLFEEDNENYKDDKVNRVILFVSAGDSEEDMEDIYEALKNETEKQNNSIVLLTYGIGDANFTLLEKMATYYRNVSQKSQYFYLPDYKKLLFELPFYYRHLFENVVLEPSWTTPYLDALGLGQVMSASLAVVVNNTRVGVVSVDVTVEDLIVDAKFFKPNEYSYAFVIDGKGSVLYHPFYPSVISTETVYVEATALEQDKEFLDVFDSMKRGKNGNTSYVASKYLRTGGGRTTSVKKLKMHTNYIWKKIPNTNFSICLALSLNASIAVLSSNDSVPPGSFLHDRMDLVPPKSPCVHALPTRPLSSKDRTSVSITARSYKDPEVYLFRNFTKEDILSIGSFMEGAAPNAFNIKNEAKQDVFLTYKAEELWLKDDDYTELKRHIGNRWIGTKSGVMRVYPAASLPQLYDPVLRPWYIAGEAQADKYVITVPYDVARSFGLFHYISLCKALTHHTGKGSNERNQVIAVASMGIFSHYFESIVRDLYADWITSDDYKLYVIDSAGYLILAEQYSKDKTVLHLTDVEPQVSSVLFLQGIFRRVNCSRLHLGLLHRQYLLEFPSNNTIFRGFIRGSESKCYSFSFYGVSETNVFILVRTMFHVDCENVYKGHADFCQCKNDTSKTCKTTWNSTDDCECPCNDVNPHYIPCTNAYEIQNESFLTPPCGPRIIYSDYSDSTGELNVSDLPICYELYLGLKTDNTFSTFVLSSSLSTLLIVVIVAYATLHQLSKRSLAKRRDTMRVKPTQFQAETSGNEKSYSDAEATRNGFKDPTTAELHNT